MPACAAAPLFVRSVPRRNHQKVSLSSPYVHLGKVVFPRGSSYIIHLFSRQPAKMAARPTVTVYAASGEASGSLALPSVFTAPIRLDVVQQVHSELKTRPRGQLRGEKEGNLRGFLQGGSILATRSMGVRAMAAEMEGVKVERNNPGHISNKRGETRDTNKHIDRDRDRQRSTSIATTQPRRTMMHYPAHPLQKKPSQTPSPPQNLVMD